MTYDPENSSEKPIVPVIGEGDKVSVPDDAVLYRINISTGRRGAFFEQNPDSSLLFVVDTVGERFNVFTEVLAEGVERKPLELHHRKDKDLNSFNFFIPDRKINNPEKVAIGTTALAAVVTAIWLYRRRKNKS